MRKLVCVLGLVFVTALPAVAQDEPQVEFFGGYSYLRVNPGSGASGINANGGSGNVAFNLTPSVGIVGDFGVYRAGDLGLGIVLPGVDTSGNMISYLFGPRLTVRGSRVDPFVQALFGGIRATAEATVSGVTTSISDNAFGMALGGGVDVKATPRVAVRIFQAEYVLTRFSFLGTSANQHNARISAGVVFRFGEQ